MTFGMRRRDLLGSGDHATEELRVKPRPDTQPINRHATPPVVANWEIAAIALKTPIHAT